MKNKDSKINLLFITQKIHKDDDDLAFVILWIKQFEREGFNVSVICLEKGEFDDSFPVFSLGKEKGYGKLRRIFIFLKYILTLKYDRVFVHMNPEYFTLGGWYWFLTGIPTYLWYTHYKMHTHMFLAGFFAKRLFAATKQSMPQYNNSPKKIVLGHGIDINYWSEMKNVYPRHVHLKNLISVHRICRSKRLEIGINALTYLESEFKLSVYGRDVEKDYDANMKELVRQKGLETRVKFYGPLPMKELGSVYSSHRVMINMASETIDKTMLEGMLFGVYPVTTRQNSIAIGLPEYPSDDDPKSIAEFIALGKWEKYDKEFLSSIVKNKHSLEGLIRNLGNYISLGE